MLDIAPHSKALTEIGRKLVFHMKSCELGTGQTCLRLSETFCDQAFQIPLENIPRVNVVVFSECEIIMLPLLSANTVRFTVYTVLPRTTFWDARGVDT